MKFHKKITAINSPIEGDLAYRKAIQNGLLKEMKLYPTLKDSEEGVWKKIDVSTINIVDSRDKEPLEITDATIHPRALILDELTRHRHTFQLFVPITGSFMAVVSPSIQNDESRPDMNRVDIIPVHPGEAIYIEQGSWHTLPFTFTGIVKSLSIMHREDLNSYHDVRDLAAEGWIGYVNLLDTV